MPSMTSEDLRNRSGELRRAIDRGEELEILFHGKPLATALPTKRLQAERAELEQLRIRVAALEGGAPSTLEAAS